MKRALFAASTWVLLLLLRGATPMSAQAPDALTFFKNYFITGDYVVGGVGLRDQGVNGIATGSVTISGVPQDADVAAAFLYWQVVSKDSLGPDSGSVPVTFKSHPLRSVAGPLGKALGAGTAPCWSSGGGTGSSGGTNMTYSYRADVLRFFDIDETTGKFIVNGQHQVQLPDGGGPTALGATVVVIYRDPTLPLSAIVMYDGAYTMDQSQESMSQRIQGFYQPAGTAGKLTHIVGSGQANKPERLLFNGIPIASNPFQGAVGASWDNPTFQVTSQPSLTQVTTSVDHAGSNTFDCLTWNAIIYRTEVKDSDGDGLLDIWESSPTTILDPGGKPLPLLSAMGADPGRKDLFIEAGYMGVGAATSYGDEMKPAHTHLPSQQALKLVGDALKGGPDPIAVHFDMGNAYALPGPDGPSAEEYIIRGAGARGGEAVDELATVCVPGQTDAPWVCQFSRYPGTVGWKTGFRFLRDEVLSVTPPPGIAAPPPGEELCEQPGYTCNRRFDRNRKDMFRYVLFAHALGLPKSEDPADPDFHVPRTNTGIGDFPGGDVMVTLGAFADTAGNPVGTPFMQASTLTHELGHAFERRHGGEAFEPNCKPTYLSVMNYLYQLRGLLDDGGKPHLDFSRAINQPIDETSLFDGPSGGLPYRIGWYAPLAGSHLEGFGRAAAKHCDGSDLLVTDVPMVRIDNRTAASAIDWNADGRLESAFALDVNFNGRTTKADGSADILGGSNDWAHLILNQTGARRSPGALFVLDGTGRLALGPLSLDSGRGDLGRGDLGRGDLGRGDLGRGDLGRGDLGRGDLGRGDLGRGDLGGPVLGRGDLGRGDLGGGDLFARDPNNPGGELDFETATDLARTPPNEFRACVTGIDCPAQALPLHLVRLDWTASHVGSVTDYVVYRVPGATLLPGQQWTSVGAVSATPAQIDYTLVDGARLTGGAPYTYFAVAIYSDGIQSDPSNLVTITAVDDAPAILDIPDQTISANSSAGPVSFTITDEDPAGVILSGTSSNTTLVPAAGIVFGGSGSNRTVTVTPAAGQAGTATITVRATDASGHTASDTFLLTVKPVVSLYTFLGYLSPLITAGTDALPSNSGSFNFGKAIPLKWQLKQGGSFVSDLRTLAVLEAVRGTASTTNSSCSPDGSSPIQLLDPASGRPTGNSTYRYDVANKQFVFNWDTSAASNAACYRLRLGLADGSAAKVTIIRFK
jgi:hypothetical protein